MTKLKQLFKKGDMDLIHQYFESQKGADLKKIAKNLIFLPHSKFFCFSKILQHYHPTVVEQINQNITLYFHFIDFSTNAEIKQKIVFNFILDYDEVINFKYFKQDNLFFWSFFVGLLCNNYGYPSIDDTFYSVARELIDFYKQMGYPKLHIGEVRCLWYDMVFDSKCFLLIIDLL